MCHILHIWVSLQSVRISRLNMLVSHDQNMRTGMADLLQSDSSTRLTLKTLDPTSLIDKKRHLTDCKEVDKVRRYLPHESSISHGKDRKNWWVKVAEEVEVVAASCNRQRLVKITYDTGGRLALVRKTAWDTNGEGNRARKHRHHCWAEYFR